MCKSAKTLRFYIKKACYNIIVEFEGFTPYSSQSTFFGKGALVTRERLCFYKKRILDTNIKM